MLNKTITKALRIIVNSHEVTLEGQSFKAFALPPYKILLSNYKVNLLHKLVHTEAQPTLGANNFFHNTTARPKNERHSFIQTEASQGHLMYPTN